MKIKVSVSPINADALSAALKTLHIPVPGFVINGVLSFKTQVEKVIIGIVRTMLKKRTSTYSLRG